MTLLEHPEVHLQYANLQNSSGGKTLARVDWQEIFPPTNIRIKIDGNKIGISRTEHVIHELMHLIFFDLFEHHVGDEMEEDAILAWERGMHKYMTSKSSLQKKWSEMIDLKLSVARNDPEEDTL